MFWKSLRKRVTLPMVTIVRLYVVAVVTGKGVIEVVFTLIAQGNVQMRKISCWQRMRC